MKRRSVRSIRRIFRYSARIRSTDIRDTHPLQPLFNETTPHAAALGVLVSSASNGLCVRSASVVEEQYLYLNRCPGDLS